MKVAPPTCALQGGAEPAQLGVGQLGDAAQEEQPAGPPRREDLLHPLPPGFPLRLEPPGSSRKLMSPLLTSGDRWSGSSWSTGRPGWPPYSLGFSRFCSYYTVFTAHCLLHAAYLTLHTAGPRSHGEAGVGHTEKPPPREFPGGRIGFQQSIDPRSRFPHTENSPGEEDEQDEGVRISQHEASPGSAELDRGQEGD